MSSQAIAGNLGDSDVTTQYDPLHGDVSMLHMLLSLTEGRQGRSQPEGICHFGVSANGTCKAGHERREIGSGLGQSNVFNRHDLRAETGARGDCGFFRRKAND